MPYTKIYTFANDDVYFARAWDYSYNNAFTKPCELGYTNDIQVGHVYSSDPDIYGILYGIAPVNISDTERHFITSAILNIYIDCDTRLAPFELEVRANSGFHSFVPGAALPSVYEMMQLPIVGKSRSLDWSTDYGEAGWVQIPLTIKRRYMHSSLTLVFTSSISHSLVPVTTACVIESQGAHTPYMNVTYNHYIGTENYDMNNY
jgi:hypothetical protein